MNRLMMRIRALVAFTSVVFRAVVRDRTALFFMVVLPVAIIVVIGAVFGGQSRLRLAVVHDRPGELADSIVAGLDEQSGLELESYDSVDEADRAVRRRDVAGALVIPADFDARLLAGDQATLSLRALSNEQQAQVARQAVDGVVHGLTANVGAAQVVSEVLGGSVRDNLDATGAVAPAPLAVEVDDVGASAADLNRFSLVAPQNLVLSTFINAMAAGSFLVRTRRTGILRRALTARHGTGVLIGGLALGWFALTLAQSLLIVIIGAVGFGVRWGDPLAAGLLVVAFAAVGSGAGLLVGALGNDEDRVSSITPVIGLVLGALGGCMVPLEIFPPVMRAAAHITPQYWAVSAWERLVFDGAGVGAIAGSLGVLAAVAAALLTLAAAAFHRRLTT